MNLWIRTQNNGLQQVTGIDEPYKTFINNEYCYVIRGNNFGTSFELGTYESKERALEVLDEIKEYMTTDKNSSWEYRKYGCYEDCLCYKSDILMIYQMPKE